ncbi:hypothetical protein KZO25_03875 [Halomonas sp. ANAO-440]|uniref:hypothetical protein n=1 Tax=Halomonas sp. ANAO-440 TaxID=2861360 RepID=UPI001CAA69C7|nr:hypothetical protein [Halomonas sp. ANAO-440]MBZ0329451.1 hypothetical protein [Halomonas sp. ANAO-440]
MKRSMSRTLLMPALLAVAIAPLSLAATAGQGDKGWNEQRQALFERAGLDEETRAALEEAHDEHRQALRELHQQHRERMDEILDEDEREALREAKREMRQEHHGERQGYGRQGFPQRLSTLVDSWDLSDEEREELTELRQSLYADMRELREQSFDSREERREAWQALRDEHQEALGEVLSEEQIEAMKAMMQPQGHKGHGKAHGQKHDR